MSEVVRFSFHLPSWNFRREPSTDFKRFAHALVPRLTDFGTALVPSSQANFIAAAQ